MGSWFYDFIQKFAYKYLVDNDQHEQNRVNV